ncbi:hypothetical protein WMY93_033270 [Mugilogobius chulae]|uniref:Uncharacterized protein n=1 Tax=Mugilogobius chulae TaxID=88201 RepID=A0AAW0MHM2_9GOBI
MYPPKTRVSPPVARVPPEPNSGSVSLRHSLLSDCPAFTCVGLFTCVRLLLVRASVCSVGLPTLSTQDLTRDRGLDRGQDRRRRQEQQKWDKTGDRTELLQDILPRRAPGQDLDPGQERGPWTVDGDLGPGGGGDGRGQ